MRLALQQLIVSASLCLTFAPAVAQASASAASESRDAALAYIGTMNFAVGRLGRDCLNLTGASETPQQFASRWQQRNQRYLAASSKYLTQRLNEVQDKTQQTALQAELSKAVQSSAAKILQNWLGQGDKSSACQRVLASVERGDYDFNPTSEMYVELESLVRWAQP